MILFVFEGVKREPMLFKTIQYLFFPNKNNQIVCSFGNNIYQLYKEIERLKINGEDYSDIVSILKNKWKNNENNPLKDVMNSDDFSEIYLFFDYDFQQHKLSLSEINQQVEEMLELFDNETENGKLYINYPMIESIRYTKQLPDAEYYKYTVTRADCKRFKNLANSFSSYPTLDFLLLNSKSKLEYIRNNWLFLKQQNVTKANFLCTGHNEFPTNKFLVSQQNVFAKQVEKYILEDDCRVSILNSFPLFLYDYFGK